MTIQELIDRLRTFPPNMPVKALWDCTPNFSIHRVELWNSFNGLVALLDCGAGDGDWDLIQDMRTQVLDPPHGDEQH